MPNPPESASKDGLSPAWQGFVFLLVLLALFTRRPDMFLYAQFYAEDGRNWYAQAYNLGWLHALFVPVNGYLQVLSRLVAALSLLVPLRHAPLLMNSAGLLVQAAPVTALLSARCRIWGSLPLRLAMAAIYVAIPNADEIHVVLTNAHWHLAVLEVLLAFGAPPRSRIGQCMDVAIFAIGSVSNPLCFFLLPLVVFFWWRRRQPWSMVIGVILASGAAIQLLNVIHASRSSGSPLGARPMLFVRILAGNVFLSSLFGTGDYSYTIPGLILLLVFLAGMVVLAIGLLRGPLSLRLMILFSCAAMCAGLLSPLVGHTHDPIWFLLLFARGFRYWYYPMLAFLWVAAWCAFSGQRTFVRAAGVALLLCMMFGVVRDWRYPPMPDHQFPHYVAVFEQARPFEHVLIPIFPSGWSMELVKHAR